MDSPTANDFRYRVEWSAADQEYVGLVDGGLFPSLSWLAATADEAERGIRAVVDEMLPDLLDLYDEMPDDAEGVWMVGTQGSTHIIDRTGSWTHTRYAAPSSGLGPLMTDGKPRLISGTMPQPKVGESFVIHYRPFRDGNWHMVSEVRYIAHIRPVG